MALSKQGPAVLSCDLSTVTFKCCDHDIVPTS
jgi:hypothetical protein